MDHSNGVVGVLKKFKNKYPDLYEFILFNLNYAYASN